MIKESIIRKPDGTIISFEEFILELKKNNLKEGDIAVGSDSQVLGNKVSFVTTICILNPGLGGKFFYVKEKIDLSYFKNLRMRIMNEVILSISIASELQEIIPTKIEVHLDIGSDEMRSRTSKFRSEFTGMVQASGFVCRIKPESWASYVADKFTKS
jgi:predicted RNase H-related nuclease YkuK (DUF458 family)